MKRDKYGNSGKPGSAGMLCFPSWTSPVRVRSPALNTPMTYTPSESLIPTASSFHELLALTTDALFAAGTECVHHRGPTQYRYTFVPTGTFLYIHSMSSSVMRMQPCDAE